MVDDSPAAIQCLTDYRKYGRNLKWSLALFAYGVLCRLPLPQELSYVFVSNHWGADSIR